MRRLALLLALAALYAFPSLAQTSVGVFTAHECTSSPTTCSATRSASTIGAGHLIVATAIIYGCASTCNATFTIGDDAGSTYIESPDGPIDLTGGGNYRIRTFYTCSSGSGGGTKVTANYPSAGASFLFVVANEYSYSNVCALAQHGFGSNNGSVTTFSTSNVVTTVTNQLLVSGAGQFNGTSAFSSVVDGASHSYTIRSQDNFIGLADITEATAATYKAQWSWTNNSSAGGHVLSFTFLAATNVPRKKMGPF